MAYHGQEALTYSSEMDLMPGSLVRIELRKRPTLGIVLHAVTKPTFETKPIQAVSECSPLPPEQLELLRWIYAYYPAPLGSVVRQFVPSSDIFPKPIHEAEPTIVNLSILPSVSPDQENAIKLIKGPGTFLLHGITGSGKSRVYIELAARIITTGKSAIVLTPEIGLTAQLTESFRQVFGDSVYVLHSQLTAAQRRNIYYELLDRNQTSIVIGPRSALFSPLKNIGLIVLDEAHDGAYKNESAPHYLSSRVAAKIAALHGATLVLGSATPAIDDYYLAHLKHRPIVSMQALAKQAQTPVSIEMVDMRKPDQFNRNSLLSDTLLTHISNAMQHGEQSLIFLNRRGTANVVLCNTCGWQSLCPNCDLSLTYHGDTHEQRCHVCGYVAGLPTSCPLCGGTEILFKSIGTKAVVDAVQKTFPTSRIQRFDTDAKKSERLEQHLKSLAEGSVDIIVGTQMIGKGLDLPKLSVVGIVNADSSLLIPDFTAAEQTYQLISQVIGRVGRGHRPGTVIVQTYDPENPTLQAALGGKWDDFYNAELSERKTFRFPPFTHLLKLRVLRATAKTAEKAANELAYALASTYPSCTVEGPAPSFHPRERGKYSWQVLIKAADRKSLTSIIKSLPSGWSYDIDPKNLL